MISTSRITSRLAEELRWARCVDSKVNGSCIVGIFFILEVRLKNKVKQAKKDLHVQAFIFQTPVLVSLPHSLH